MKRSKKITIGIILFFVIITVIIVGRYSMGLYFKKKFSKRPPPGIIVEVVTNKNFSQTLAIDFFLRPVAYLEFLKSNLTFLLTDSVFN